MLVVLGSTRGFRQRSDRALGRHQLCNAENEGAFGTAYRPSRVDLSMKGVAWRFGRSGALRMSRQ